MNALLRKELRLIGPFWLAALLLTCLPLLLISRDTRSEILNTLIGACVVLGMVLVSLAPFGQECSAGTLSSLLAQPIDRVRLWRIKFGVGIGAVASVFAVFWMCFTIRARPDGPHVLELFASSVIAAAALFTGGLWTTLLLRQVMAAFWLTLVIPAALMVWTLFLMDKYSDQFQTLTGMIVLGIYAMAGVIWSRKLFLNAQDTTWTGGTISVPQLRFMRARPAASVRRHRPIAALLRKEFQSHQTVLLLSAVMFLLHLTLIVMRKIAFEPGRQETLFFELSAITWLLWLAAPMIIGATLVADERRAGTMESALCLPIRRSIQAVIKLFPALLLGTFLGGVMPWLLERFSLWIGNPGSVLFEEPTHWRNYRTALARACAGAALITFIASYASTLSRNFLQSMGVAVIVGFTVFVGFAGADDAGLVASELVFYLSLGTLVVALMVLSWRNFQWLHAGWDLWWRNALALSAAFLLAILLGNAVYLRIWELALNTEPPHGPPKLTGRLSPQIKVIDPYVLTLLPDGRLWIATNYQWRAVDQYGLFRDRNSENYWQQIQLPFPTAGSFLKGNWAAIAATWRDLWGIQSDGTLWHCRPERLAETSLEPLSLREFRRSAPPNARPPNTPLTNTTVVVPEPRQVGAATNWKTLDAGRHFVVALKQDGTVWQFDIQSHNPLRQDQFQPRQIGSDSNWVAVFAIHESAVGVKNDGTVWQWNLILLERSRDAVQFDEPQLRYLDRPDWIAYSGNVAVDLVVREDGSLWVGGRDARWMLKKEPQRGWRTNLIRVPWESNLSDVAMHHYYLLGLKEGKLLQRNLYSRAPLGFSSRRSPSKHSDWIAIADHSGDSLSLAADGTLCWWENPWPRGSAAAGLLAPTRRPRWSLNILAAGAHRSSSARP